MKDEDDFEEEVMADSSDGEEDESSLVEDDGMTAGEEGFIRGYEEADKPRTKAEEAEEEELE